MCHVAVGNTHGGHDFKSRRISGEELDKFRGQELNTRPVIVSKCKFLGRCQLSIHLIWPLSDVQTTHTASWSRDPPTLVCILAVMGKLLPPQGALLFLWTSQLQSSLSYWRRLLSLSVSYSPALVLSSEFPWAAFSSESAWCLHLSNSLNNKSKVIEDSGLLKVGSQAGPSLRSATSGLFYYWSLGCAW